MEDSHGALCTPHMYARVMGSYSESEKASQHREMQRRRCTSAIRAEPAAPLPRHNPHDARSSGSGLGAAPRSKFALQRQPSVRQAALEHLPTPMPFTTGRFKHACPVLGQRTTVIIEQIPCLCADISVRNVRPHNARTRVLLPRPARETWLLIPSNLRLRYDACGVALHRPPQHHAHGALYRLALRPLRWAL